MKVEQEKRKVERRQNGGERGERVEESRAEKKGK